MANKGVLVLRKRTLLEGICPEVADLLKEKHIAIHTFTELRKMGPLRQIEAAELMIAMNNYTVSYARNLLAVTPQAQLANTEKPKRVPTRTAFQAPRNKISWRNVWPSWRVQMNRRDFGATMAAILVMALFLAVRALAARISGGKLSRRAVTVVALMVLVVLAAGAAGGALLFEEMSSK